MRWPGLALTIHPQSPVIASKLSIRLLQGKIPAPQWVQLPLEEPSCTVEHSNFSPADTLQFWVSRPTASLETGERRA